MDKRILIVTILVLSMVGTASAMTWSVDGSGGADFITIQDAINNASVGDTILVYSGVYYENVVVDKSVTLKGVGYPIVDASGEGDAITLCADGITLVGFTATNSGSSWRVAGIKVTSNNNIIAGNIANNNCFGISLVDSSNNNTITGNDVSNYWGIYLSYSSNNTITGNNVSYNYWGIRLSYSSNNTITGNNVSSNNRGGICLDDSSNNTITGNNVSNNNEEGIRLSYSSNNNTITGNVFVNDGLSVYSSYQNTVENNTVNDKPLVYLEDVSNYKVEDAGQVILVNCTNITVENLELSNTSVGIKLRKTTNSRISNNNISNNYDGIYISSSSNNNTITGNNVSNNKNGIRLYYSSNNNTITSNNASSNGVGICLSSSSNNNSITGNNVCKNYGDGISLGSLGSLGHSDVISLTGSNVCSYNWTGISLGHNSNNNSITGNNIGNNRGYGIYLSDSCNNNITGNRFVNDGLFVESPYQNTMENNTVNDKPLVYLEDVSDYKVKDAGQVILVNCNNITIKNLDLANTNVGIELLNTENSIISNITLNSSNNIGIGLYYSRNNSITGNSADNNNIKGIYLLYSCNNSITGNSANNNNIKGIYLLHSCNNIITDNNVCNNRNGIYLFFSCNNSITRNNVRSNVNGICLENSHNNIVTGNNAYINSRNGIYLSYDSYNKWEDDIYPFDSSNKIYLNNLINNADNAHSHKSTNIWNSTEKITYTYNGTTYESYVGNYWSDYEGTDADGDGIGNTAYRIDSDKDFYPLMQPQQNYVREENFRNGIHDA